MCSSEVAEYGQTLTHDDRLTLQFCPRCCVDNRAYTLANSRVGLAGAASTQNECA